MAETGDEYLRILVSALTTFEGRDDKVPTDLIQLDVDAAALTLRPDGRLVIVLVHDETRIRRDLLDDRLGNVLRTERREVIAGLSPGKCDVVLLHAPPVAPPGLPRKSLRLQREIDWYAITADGRVLGPRDDRRHLLGYAITEAQRRGRAADLSAIERRGEERIGEVGKQRLFNRFARNLLRAPVTIGLGILLCVIFGLQLAWGAVANRAALEAMGAMVSTRVTLDHEYWRLIDAGYLHGGLGHILGNLEALIACYFAEIVLRQSRFILLFTITVIGGNLAVLWFSEAGVTVGASGGIFGLAAGVFWLTIRERRLWPPGWFAAGLRIGFGIMLAFSLYTSLGPGVSLAAHAGGFVTGTVLVLSGVLTRGLPRVWMYERAHPGATLAYRIAAGVCLALTVASLAIAWGTQKPWAASRTDRLEEYGDSLIDKHVTLPGMPVSLDVPPRLADPHSLGGGRAAIGDPDNPVVLVQLYPLAVPESDAPRMLREYLMRYSEADIKIVELGDHTAVEVVASVISYRYYVVARGMLIELTFEGNTSDRLRASIASSVRIDKPEAPFVAPAPAWRAVAKVSFSAGADVFGETCVVTRTRYADGETGCRWRVVCDGKVVYGDWFSGWGTCGASVHDASITDGDPRFDLDAGAGTLEITDASMTIRAQLEVESR